MQKKLQSLCFPVCFHIIYLSLITFFNLSLDQAAAMAVRLFVNPRRERLTVPLTAFKWFALVKCKVICMHIHANAPFNCVVFCHEACCSF